MPWWGEVGIHIPESFPTSPTRMCMHACTHAHSYSKVIIDSLCSLNFHMCAVGTTDTVGTDSWRQIEFSPWHLHRIWFTKAKPFSICHRLWKHDHTLHDHVMLLLQALCDLLWNIIKNCFCQSTGLGNRKGLLECCWSWWAIIAVGHG